MWEQSVLHKAGRGMSHAWLDPRGATHATLCKLKKNQTPRSPVESRERWPQEGRAGGRAGGTNEENTPLISKIAIKRS